MGQGSCCTPGEKRCGCEDGHQGQPFARISTGSTDHMVRLEGGAFLMGTEDGIGYPDDGEGPIREVTLDPFLMDQYAVSNADFATFIEATGHQTDAQKFGYSYVFHLLLSPSQKRTLDMLGRTVMGLEWWYHVEGADWAHPFGPESDITGLENHPATHVSYRDALAYCAWAGKRLPTEAEVEYAARGGLVGKRHAWGDELMPGGKHMCNIFQGKFPEYNSGEDGFVGTAPVDAYEPNNYGLYNMAGNVWEWVFDWWSPDFHITGPRNNPIGPDSGERRVNRGGSYLCHDSYCNRYRVAARTSNTPDSSTGNLGFRCVRDVKSDD
ncbi:Serine/threonine-protein kinase pkn1 [Pontiella desulfatans]|uniref:Serine/threonine-protein kinase pkn1 n=2 Tax=Pontiella desulfatans TaxID=2750659 RepID=A0A6C2U896_PONDE|nr:Serine/threonine-protein kinase pkn1 [Pontiella desulfatans]